jgi:nucleotide-binding universal stress UspA family protein
MKNILLPVDDSIYSTQALQYVVTMSPDLQDIHYSLFYVQPILSDYILEEAEHDPVAMKKLERLNERNAALADTILKRHKERLVQSKVPEENIKLLTMRRELGASKDIIQQAYDLSADAIVMGRRGLSKIQEAFIGSTTKAVVDNSSDIPVWVIDSEITSRKILLAVDGSTNSIRALDYLLDFVHPDSAFDLTLYHVQPSLRDCCEIDFTASQSPEDLEAVAGIIEKADRHCIDNFMGLARRKFEEKKIHGDRIKTKTQQTKLSIGGAIVDEFNNNGYGTLIVGKRGIDKKFFMGSVSNYLISQMERGALWVVP